MEFNLNNVIVERKSKKVYKDNGKTIKLFVENYSKASILNEAHNHARVEEGTSLNIPKLLQVCKIDGKWAIVLEHIEGTTLEELIKQNPEKEKEYLELLVKIQLEILSNQVHLLNPIKEKYKRKISESSLNDNIKYELLQRIEGMKNHTKLCHGDLDPSNIIITEKGDYYIIDWAHVTQGNASADCAKTYLLLSLEYGKDFADNYLDMFSQKSTIEKSLIQRWIPVVAGIQLIDGSDNKEILKEWIDIVDFQ